MRDKRNEAYQLINAVLNGLSDKVDLELLITPADACSYINEQGCEDDDVLDTNGWQWDFWQYFIREKDNQGFCLSGSGFYGKLKFSKGGREE